MTIFTTVPDNVLEPGDPIRSVDIIAIKDNTIFTYEGLSYEILDTQTFTSSGTWTKPTNIDPATDSAIVILVGGGGSGAAARTAGTVGVAGGGGVGIGIGAVAIGALSSTETVTIGAGGAAVSITAQGATSGNQGGTTSIGSITKPGGGGGFASENNPGQSGQGGVGNGIVTNVSTFFSELARAGRFAFNDTTTSAQPEYSGGGANGNNGTTQRTQNRAAGPAKVFSFVTLGAGGDGDQVTGANGSNPGGGGGGASNNNANATSGEGGIGWARVYVVRGSPAAGDFYQRKLT